MTRDDARGKQEVYREPVSRRRGEVAKAAGRPMPRSDARLTPMPELQNRLGEAGPGGNVCPITPRPHIGLLASGVGQSDPAARAHRADLGRPRGGRPNGGRPDWADDPDLRSLGARVRPDRVGGAWHAAPRPRNPQAALVARRRDGRLRLYGVQRSLLRSRASHRRTQHVDHPGFDPGWCWSAPVCVSG